jgi:hypothetical protein
MVVVNMLLHELYNQFGWDMPQLAAHLPLLLKVQDVQATRRHINRPLYHTRLLPSLKHACVSCDLMYSLPKEREYLPESVVNFVTVGHLRTCRRSSASSSS